ncbi:unnamed protein product, partial [Cylicocyclus nassatus]
SSGINAEYCSATRCAAWSRAASRSTRTCCWILPARCFTWMPRWTTRWPIWAPAAVARTTRARSRTGARWKCWRTKRSPTSRRRANTLSPSSKPAGTMPSCRTCRACWAMWPAHCACSTWARRPTTCAVCSSTSRPS